MSVGPFGPRATIVKVGVCEMFDDGTWYVTGWIFNGRRDPRLAPSGCPFMHDDAGCHIGWLGWTFEELHAVQEAEFALAGLKTTDSPS